MPSESRRRASSILKAVLFHAEVAGWLLGLVLGLAGKRRGAAAGVAVALGARVAGRWWSRRCPGPMPHFMRWVLLGHRGWHTPARLCGLLRPLSGERILEIGPGVGVHALSVAAALAPGGQLDVLDVQPEMLADLGRRAARRGLLQIVPYLGDAQALPYATSTFDAAYLISVLGEIPEARLALRELRRVLKPGGRLLVGEVLVDPDFVSLPALRALAAETGFVLERSVGPRFFYTAVLRPADGRPAR